MTSNAMRWATPFVLTASLLTGCAVIPNPVGEIELSGLNGDRLVQVDAAQEPVSGAIDLYEAMARALKYNLDHHVELFQQSLRVAELDLSHFSLLPKAVVNSGYAERNNDSASSSFNLVTDQPNFGASTSTERRLKTADITFSWNVLDFGLSYVRARQAADKVLIADELRRKAAHRIIEDVRTAFWRALSAERLIVKVRRLEGRTRRALANARQIADSGETSPITALTYERELVEVKRTLQELQRDLSVAKTQLAALMNLKPGTRFALKAPTRGPATPALKMGVPEMIRTALDNRPEVRENVYKLRINDHERDAALLELLPGVQVLAGANFDSNDFLFHNNWVHWGAKASWNLVKLFQAPAKREVIDAQGRLLEQRGLALTMAIMTQVHVSRVRFLYLNRELSTAREYANVQRRLVEQIRLEAAADRVSEQTLIREELNYLVAQAKRDLSFANVQNAYANVFASMGLDPHYAGFEEDMSVRDLAGALRELWFERGDYAAKVRIASAKR